MRDNFKEHDLYDDNVQFFKGLFKHTLPEFYQNYSTTNLSMSILRIDGNYYDSHQDALHPCRRWNSFLLYGLEFKALRNKRWPRCGPSLGRIMNATHDKFHY